ncbi:MAG TPA: MFS transporter [Leptolinea sp.]
MIISFQKARKEYPRQFWLLFWGLLISTSGASMIWPFLMVYVSGRLHLPLTAAATIMTINAAAAILFTFVAGPATDRFGRKWVMVISLLGNGLVYILYQEASTLWQFSIISALAGAFNPLFRVGADAMLADLIPAEKRIDAYSLLRLSNNLGVSIGPAIGGFLASSSYTIAFLCAAGGMCTYGLMMLILGKETIPSYKKDQKIIKQPSEKFGGYGIIFRDRPYMQFVAVFALIQICAALVWVLLAVYSKQQYGMPENQYGFLPTTNGIMIVLLQLGITNWTRRYPTYSMLALGSFFYGFATLSIAFMTGFWGFWLSMVILTMGEMILMPTSSTFAANMAPSDMRGRYMSLYSLTWGLSMGIGPVLGGLLSDNLGPRTIWYGGGVVGAISVIAFISLKNKYKDNQPFSNSMYNLALPTEPNIKEPSDL